MVTKIVVGKTIHSRVQRYKYGSSHFHSVLPRLRNNETRSSPGQSHHNPTSVLIDVLVNRTLGQKDRQVNKPQRDAKEPVTSLPGLLAAE